ncbi:hypothetical protein ABEB36_002293 [Hypothenemus hampei]
MASIEAAKAALRKTIADNVGKLSTEEKERQSKIVFNRLINLPEFKNSKRVSVFLSTSDEIDTEPMVRKIFEGNKLCFVPRYSKAGMQMVRLASMEDWENLPVTKWNIKQPLLKDQREDAIETGGLDLVICPGVAFTPKGDRLGHGGGYYDAYLKKLSEIQKQPPATVAVGFKQQIVESLPLTPTDFNVKVVLFAD